MRLLLRSSLIFVSTVYLRQFVPIFSVIAVHSLLNNKKCPLFQTDKITLEVDIKCFQKHILWHG